ncbi:hypothetical protein Tco_0935807, partial [Tanacetum coccineum]
MHLFFCRHGLKMKSKASYSDSSYGINTDQGKGTTGIVFYFGESPITWCTQKQPTVALSSCESEFMAATGAACQALWLKRLLSELTGWEEKRITLKVDNVSAIALVRNPVFHGRSKHIDIRYHFIRECVENGHINVEHISGELQRADILTKALPRLKFVTMLLGQQLASRASGYTLRFLNTNSNQRGSQEGKNAENILGSQPERVANVYIKRHWWDKTSLETSKGKEGNSCRLQGDVEQEKDQEQTYKEKFEATWEVIEHEENTQIDDKKDKATTTFLYQALTEDVILQVASCKTANELWESLRKRHVGEEKVQQARLQSLMIGFNTLQMKEDKTIPHQIVASIEQTSDLDEITLDEITGKLKAFEERIKLRKRGQVESQENLLFAQGEHSGKGRRFSKCG